VKRRNEDVLTILVVAAIIMLIIGSSYIIRDTNNSGEINSNRVEEGQKPISEQLSDKEKSVTNQIYIRAVIDGIMAIGLLLGLSLILQDKVNYVFIFLVVGIIVAFVDFYLRKLF